MDGKVYNQRSSVIGELLSRPLELHGLGNVLEYDQPMSIYLRFHPIKNILSNTIATQQ